MQEAKPSMNEPKEHTDIQNWKHAPCRLKYRSGETTKASKENTANKNKTTENDNQKETE